MTFFEIRQTHPYLTSIRSWYENAFPLAERRSFDELTQLLSCSDMHLCALLVDRQLVGFLIYWQWAAVIFVEHFVIDPDQRGRQFGQQALKKLRSLPHSRIVLEVERPNDEVSRRRIQFYNRQGFFLSPFAYTQPPYQRGKPGIPMYLMSIPIIDHPTDFEQVSEWIKAQVYERFYG